MNDPLSTYLHDHPGGAKTAIDLLEAMRDGHKDQPLKDLQHISLSRFRPTALRCSAWRKQLVAGRMP
jgi:hypothetical protein